MVNLGLLPTLLVPRLQVNTTHLQAQHMNTASTAAACYHPPASGRVVCGLPRAAARARASRHHVERQHGCWAGRLPVPEAAGLPDAAGAGLVRRLVQHGATHDERNLVHKQQQVAQRRAGGLVKQRSSNRVRQTGEGWLMLMLDAWGRSADNAIHNRCRESDSAYICRTLATGIAAAAATAQAANRLIIPC